MNSHEVTIYMENGSLTYDTTEDAIQQLIDGFATDSGTVTVHDNKTRVMTIIPKRRVLSMVAKPIDGRERKKVQA